MDIKKLDKVDIDRIRWDATVKSSPHFRHYALSYFLDAATDQWMGLVWGDYEVVWPVPFKRWPYPRVIQPLLAQQLGPYSANAISVALLQEGWNAIRLHFIAGYQKVNSAFTEFPDLQCTYRNVVLHINRPTSEIRSGYNRNVKGNLKKAQMANVLCTSQTGGIELLASMFNENRGRGISVLNKDFYRQLIEIYAAFSSRGEAEIWLACIENRVLGGLALLKTGGRILAFFSSVNAEGRNVGAMHALFDTVFSTYAEKAKVFDFEGSNDQNLAFFYLSFGGTEEVYLQSGFSRFPAILQKLLP